MFVVGVALALWSASGYVAAFMRAGNAIGKPPQGCPIWKTLPVRVGVTVITVIVLAIGAVAVVVTGPIAQRAGDLLGLGGAAVTAWDIAKWPVLVVLFGLLLSILYYAANVIHPVFRASYNKAYGALGGVIVFLGRLWVSNISILLGAEFDAELARERSIQAGLPADKEPYLPLRNTPEAAPSLSVADRFASAALV